MAVLAGCEESFDDFDSDVACGVIGVDVECKSDDGVNSNTHGALEVIALTVLNEVVDNQNGDEENHGLEALEVERHWLVHDPAENDKEWGNEEGDLHGAANGDVDSQIHLALVCDNDGRDVFGCVSDYRYQYKTDKSLTDVCGFNNGVDAINEVLGADCDKDSDDNESDAGGCWGENLGLLGLFVSALVLNICEQGMMRVELEV